MSLQVIARRFNIDDLEKDLLGRGGMGEVYRATDTQTGEVVAIKALDPQFVAQNPGLLERFVREGEALRKLNHPNIVRFIASVEEAACHYLVMEHVPGGSLETLLNEAGRLAPSRTVEIALEVADALSRAHHLGILHRDLKPANVLMASDGTPRLADFGIALDASGQRLTQTGVMVGTVDYLSPEVCQGEPPDERSDIWSFGVLLFQMLTGDLPFKGDNLTAKLTDILTQATPDITQSVPDIPDALADLVYRMLEKDPQHRIPSVRMVGAELEALLKGREPARRESRFATPRLRADGPRHNLPLQTTPFAGREAELHALARLLEDPGVRLVSVVALGGMGKTRLALEAGSRLLERFAHGVWFVSLAGLETVEAMVPATAQALDFSFHEGPDPRRQLLDYLREKHLLLIFDNFEHLLACPEPGRGGGASLLSDILHMTRRVRLLTTSRARLGMPEEHLFHLGGMDLPVGDTQADVLDSGAVQLFLHGARRVRPGVELVEEDLNYVTRICRLAGGMPLGILLAAGWLEMLTPGEIAAEMQHGLDFLATELPAVSERQRSVRAVLDYSWQSLTEGERTIFRRLSVFRGGFTRVAVQAVTDASLRDLMGLVNKSLLTRTASGRYEIHEVLREYGAEKLAEAPEEERATRDRHCAHYAEFLHRREGQVFGRNQSAVLADFGAEVDNARAGWEWAAAQADVRRIGSYLEGVGELFLVRGWYSEGASLMAKAARSLYVAQEGAVGDAAKLVLGRVVLWQGRLGDAFESSGNTRELFRGSTAIFRELGAQRELAYALCYSAGCDRSYGESDAAPYEESLGIFQALGDQRGIALALRGKAWVALHHGDYLPAKHQFRDSLALFRELDDQVGAARSLRGLGYATWILGEYAEAKQYHRECLALCEETGNQAGIARSLGDLGVDAIGLNDHKDAKRLLQASLALFKDMGDIQGMADELGDLGELADARGEYTEAIQFAREGDALWLRTYHRPTGWTRRILGNAACGLGDLTLARSYLCQALEWSVRDERMGHIMLALIGIAALLAAEGDKSRALELLTLVRCHRASWQWARDRASALLARVEAEVPPEVIEAARERGLELDLDAIVAEMLSEMKRSQ